MLLQRAKLIWVSPCYNESSGVDVSQCAIHDAQGTEESQG